MGQKQFKAFVVKEQEGRLEGNVQTRSIDDLPDNDLLIRVRYSSLNYKDALSARGNRGVTKHYPHTPGIDAAGTVVSSRSGKFGENANVIVTGYDLGMNTAGGFGQYIKVPSEWAVELPEGMTMKESMIIGTAGLTAGLSVFRLAEHIKQADRNIVVSGATGGVGAQSVNILAKLGYTVTAVSGKEKESDFLRALGAGEVVSRKEFEKKDARPLLKGSFAGGVDTAGGTILENMIKSIRPMGVVTCCGNVASPILHMTVYPFILRGVSLIGIDSQNCPIKHRNTIWNKLAREWKPDKLIETYQEIGLDELGEHINLMLEGKLKGRTVVNLAA